MRLPRIHSPWILALTVATAHALHAAEPPASAPASTDADASKFSEQAVEEPNYDVSTRAASSNRDSEPPGYVRPLTEFDPKAAEYDWLDFGLEHRTRFEYRNDNYARDLETDDFTFMRSRGYVGIHDITDPLRFGVEFQDSRQFGSAAPSSNRDVNEADILQLFAELYFKDAVARGQPFAFRFGRMSFDDIDRRLVTRNGFRNTTNSFDGFRIRVGEPSSPWEMNAYAMQPVERFLVSPDHGDDERWFYGLTGAWRKWADVVVLEPYYLVLDSDYKDPTEDDREIHTLGIHAFGPIADTDFDYDTDHAFQFGDVGDDIHRAFANHVELGYNFEHEWKPRLAAWLNYSTGNRPNGRSGRFDSLFGASHTMYGFMDTYPWQNLIQPALFAGLRPLKKLRLEAYHRFYWLASKEDAFIRADREDPTGNSGRWLGQETDLMARYDLTERLSFEVGYAHYWPGTFVKKTGTAPDSDFFYIQTTLRF